MKATHKFLTAAALSLATISGPAFAQSANIAVGATVYGPQGGVVGTVKSVTNGVASVDTGSHVVGLPVDKFGKSAKGATISVTKAQLDQMAAQASAQASAKVDTALVAGAAVTDSKGAALGTVQSVEGNDVVLKTDAGPVKLTRKYFALGPSGGLMALVTKDQVAATLGGGADAASKVDAALVAGAPVVDNKGVALGTIDSINGDNIVLKTDAGAVTLTRKYFVLSSSGGLMALVTKDQLEATLKGSSTAATQS